MNGQEREERRKHWSEYPDNVKWDMVADDLYMLERRLTESLEYLKDIKNRVAAALIGLVGSLILLVISLATKR